MNIRDIRNVQCYGERCAITAEVVESPSTVRYKTIMLEFSERDKSITDEIRYDRTNKKQFLLTREELFYFVAFCFRNEGKCEFSGHDDNTKQLVIVRKVNGLLMLLNWGDNVRLSCLINFPKLFELINNSVLALHLNQPWISTTQMIETIKSMHIK